MTEATDALRWMTAQPEPTAQVWKLEITRSERKVSGGYTTITRESKTGFDWGHLGGTTWEFHSQDGDWNAIVTDVLFVTETLAVSTGETGETVATGRDKS